LKVAVPETLGEAEVVAVQPVPIITVLVAPVIQTLEAVHVPTTLPPHGATAPHELSPDEEPPPELEPQEARAPAAKITKSRRIMTLYRMPRRRLTQGDTASSDPPSGGASSSNFARMSSAVNGFGRRDAPEALRIRARRA